MTRRPVIVIPARFSVGATALRSRAEVAARALVEAVWAAGGEPLIVHPSAPGSTVTTDEVRERFWMVDGVLLPGGGDLSARWTGQPEHHTAYDVDEEQDAFDLALASLALEDGLPLLAVCRGNQVVNVLLGGDLVQDMGETVGDHRHRVHDIAVGDPSLRALLGDRCEVSCYHHQCLGRLGSGLVAAAVADDGVVEATLLPDRVAWYLGVQWHPEDLAATDPVQAGIFAALVAAAR